MVSLGSLIIRMQAFRRYAIMSVPMNESLFAYSSAALYFASGLSTGLRLFATADGRPLYESAGFRPNGDWMELRPR